MELSLVIINGKKYNFCSPMNISELISYLGFNIKVIVIDYNATVLPKELWGNTKLTNGDKIEILTIAGGG